MAEHPIFAPCFEKDKKGDGVAPNNSLTDGLAQLKFNPDHNTPSGMSVSLVLIFGWFSLWHSFLISCTNCLLLLISLNHSGIS